jgi:LPS export ABC transporter permease LptF/LPS export ABC transporter permease LptG
MRRIDVYIFREIVAPFLICLVVLTFIVFASELGRLVQLLMTKNLSSYTVLSVSLSILPRVLIFTLPMSFLVGIIVAFSRLSSDTEIVALRAGGVNLTQLLRPVLSFALMVWMAATVVTMVLLPLGNDRLRILTYEIGFYQLATEFRPHVFNEDLPNLVLYIDRLDNQNSRWRDIFLADTGEGKEQKIILAQKGNVLVEPETRKLQIHLQNGTIYKVDLSEIEKDNLSRFSVADLPVEMTDARIPKVREKRIEELRTWELLRHLRRAPSRELLLELNARLVLPFAVWAFAILGLPMGITTKKGGRASGLVLGILMIIAYYILFFGGKRLASVGRLPVVLGMWGADIIFLLIGVVLLIKSQREITIYGSINRLGWSGHVVGWLAPIAKPFLLLSRRLSDLSLPAARSQVLGLTGLYVTRSFLGFFILALSACLTLFIIFTLFELIDDIIRNNIPILMVVNYFRYLLPQILVLVIPIAILLATLINFGILEKSNQVTAFKAGGVSIYRLAVPVLFLALLISTGVYFLQENILPYANQRQDKIRHIIKGRPPQTAFRPERKWIFGEGTRIYNYAYFDSNQNLFAGFSVFSVDLKNQEILSRVYAARANWDEAQGWTLENGWVRSFQDKNAGFRRFAREQFNFPEQASYFKEGLLHPKETSKMTYVELSNFMGLLRKSGVDVTSLQVELYKKISFPLSGFIMALIAIPFSFSMGRKGAFHGIAISVAIGIVYWGTLNVFEVFGSRGLLAPLLAAWAPNMLYGAAGLYMLFTIKT